MSILIRKLPMQGVLIGLFFLLPVANASDESELTMLLNAFLANSGTEAAHKRFWADELVYTSSSGTRTNKAEILQSFENTDPEAADPVYSADQVQIQVFGDTAIVAFRLVSTPPEGSKETIAYYFNTGTFLKRSGEWAAVAWQATSIPPKQ